MVIWVAVVLRAQSVPPAPTPKALSPAHATDATAQRALVDRYCVMCHNQKLKTANLLLDQLDLARLGDHAEVGEKVVRKLRAGMMPPAGMPRPDAATARKLIGWLETELDRSAVTHLPPPGLHRLNRVEYANAIRDLLDVEVDTSKFLPSDDSTHGFDNMAGTLTMSPALIEAYLSAAGKISRVAIGCRARSQISDRVRRAHRHLPERTYRGSRSEHAAAWSSSISSRPTVNM